MSDNGWFEVDKKGLAQLLERRGKGFVVTELIQNAWDENVAKVEVSFSKRTSDKKWVLSIIDDSPEGFANLRDAFVLFAPSKKKADAEKRGRFNLGEKLVLALASEATITSTKGTVRFDSDGTRTETRHKRAAGTCFSDVFPTFTNKDVGEAVDLCRRLIPPIGVDTRIFATTNTGIPFADFFIQLRKEIHAFTYALPTEVADEDGVLKRTTRKTSVFVYEADPDAGFVPGIYELGIPVVDTDDKYVIDVQQKVPLNLERDNVTPSYLRTLRTAVVNELVEQIKGDESTQTWVAEALADPRIEPGAVAAIVKERFGDKVVSFDPSDPEANKLAAANGYVVLGGRTFSKDQWSNIRAAGVVESAGKVTPSSKVLVSANGIPPLDLSEWSQAHYVIAQYAGKVHKALLGHPLVVNFQHKITANRHVAWYGSGNLTINIATVGKAWLTTVTQEALDALLIHEFGHYYESDHLSESYYDALCRLGAKLRTKSEDIGSLREQSEA